MIFAFFITVSKMFLFRTLAYKEYSNLFPWAVVLWVQFLEVRFELLDDFMVLIHQTDGDLIGTAAVCPAAVPADSITLVCGTFCDSRKHEESYQSSALTAGWASSWSEV